MVGLGRRKNFLQPGSAVQRGSGADPHGHRARRSAGEIRRGHAVSVFTWPGAAARQLGRRPRGLRAARGGGVPGSGRMAARWGWDLCGTIPCARGRVCAGRHSAGLPVRAIAWRGARAAICHRISWTRTRTGADCAAVSNAKVAAAAAKFFVSVASRACLF